MTEPEPPFSKWATDFYLIEIARQCAFAVIAGHAVLTARDHSVQERLAAEAQAQAFIGAVANVSKIFWPTGSASYAKRRSAYLRSLLEIDDESPLKNRKIRNAFEHYDERLDRWISSHPWASNGLTSAEGVTGPLPHRDVPLRMVDEDGILTVGGEVYDVDISATIGLLIALHQRAEALNPLAKNPQTVVQLVTAMRPPGFVGLEGLPRPGTTPSPGP